MFSDTLADPYDASRPVFFVHVGWLLLSKLSRVLQASRRFVSVADLWAELLLALQEHLDPWWNLACCFMGRGHVRHGVRRYQVPHVAARNGA